MDIIYINVYIIHITHIYVIIWIYNGIFSHKKEILSFPTT